MKRLECLDGLRGMLAVYVMLGHMAPFAALPGWLQTAVSHGGGAVDVFFILSGLVITQSLYSAGGRAVPFLTARVARIFPVFLPVFALAVLLQPASCGFDHMPWIGPGDTARTICASGWPQAWPIDIVAHLTMTHGLFPNGVLPDIWVSFLGAAWSLSTEWQFYLLALLASRAGPDRLRNGLLALAVGGLVWHLSVPEAWQFSRAFLANKGHFFALGVASLAVVHQRRHALAAYGATLAATVAICAAQDTFGKLVPALAWTLCLAAQTQQRWWLGPLAVLLRSRPAQWFGRISYCLYLVNEPVQKLIAPGLGQLADSDAVLFTWLWLPGAIVLPIAAAVWLHRRVEGPGVEFGRRIARAWSGAHVGVVVT